MKKDPTISHPDLKVVKGDSIRQQSQHQPQPQPTPEPDPTIPEVQNTIAIVSGKGGVGKSTIAVNLAVALSQICENIGLLDADVYGPSIPTMMGINRSPESENRKLIPLKSHDVSLMSIGFMVNPDQALIWRGPMLHSAIRQFLSDVEWGELDYLVIDMPPGTGDAQLSLTQAIALTGAIVVTTPQDVALDDVRRAIAMCERMNVPILGVVENMSYYVNPASGEKISIFGSGGGQKISEKLGVPLIGQIPIDPQICECGDAGVPIVIKYPDSSQSIAFREIAERLIGEVGEIEDDELVIT